MAQIFTVNVYQINNGALSTAQLMGFAPANVKFRPAPANTTVGSTTLNGIVEEKPTGLSVHGAQYYVTQTVTQLAALANA